MPPAGWRPPPGWQPDPSWPPAPAGWNFWLGADPRYGTAPLPGAAAPLGGLTGDEVATALRILFPVQNWLHDTGLRQGLRLLVFVYALLPVIFLGVLSDSTDLSSPGWAYSLYIAPLWGAGFWMLIRPGRLGKLEVQAAAGIAVWTLIWMKIITINVNDSLHITGSIGPLPALVIGFNEEITKALPVLLAGYVLMRYRSVKLTPQMGMFLGTIAGLAFGVAEQALYTSSAIVGIHDAGANNAAINAVLSFAERIFVDGFQHAVWAGISGFFIGMALTYQRRRGQLMAVGVTVPALLHAINDFFAGVSVWLVIIVQAASLLLFLGYTLSSASIEDQVRESPIFRGDSLIMPAFRDTSRPPP